MVLQLDILGNGGKIVSSNMLMQWTGYCGTQIWQTPLLQIEYLEPVAASF